jgi:hypothetical protein
MAKCKICKEEDQGKSKSFRCEKCTEASLKCEGCGNKKSKSTYRLCKQCIGSDLTYRNNLSESLKGKVSWRKGLTKETNDSIKRSSELKKGIPLSDSHKAKISNSMSGKHVGANNPFYGKTHTDELKAKWSTERTGKLIHSEESKEKIREKLLERYENGEIQKSPKSNWYEFQGLKCQGRTELKWVERNFDRIINSRIYINTPHGTYIGDFETNDSLIEVKSFYTFSVISQNQLDKIMWIDKNIKKIIFAVERDNKFYEFSYNDEGVDWAIKKIKEIDEKD